MNETMLSIMDVAAETIKFLTSEVTRLKSGKFSEEEFQNLCHNLDESDCERFKQGCRDYQKKLFGGRVSEEEQRIIDHSQKDFVEDVDGYIYWWPAENRGHFAAHELRIIADELDRRNAVWDAQVKRELGS